MYITCEVMKENRWSGKENEGQDVIRGNRSPITLQKNELNKKQNQTKSVKKIKSGFSPNNTKVKHNS